MGATSTWDIKDPTKRWEAVKAWAAHPLVNVAASKTPGSMESDSHIDGFSNPGTTEIENLFNTVGINGLWVLFKAFEPDQIISKFVDAIVHRRNQIAHGKTDATMTLADAKIYVERAERLAEVFEQTRLMRGSRWQTVGKNWRTRFRLRSNQPR